MMATSSQMYVDAGRILVQKKLLKNAIGCPCFESTMPIPTPNASISITKGKAKSGKLITGALHTAFFNCSKASMASSVQVN